MKTFRKLISRQSYQRYWIQNPLSKNCKISLEKIFFSCIVIRQLCYNPDESFEEKKYYCWNILLFFHSFSTLSKKFYAGLSKLQSIGTVEHFDVTNCVWRRKKILGFLRTSSKKFSGFLSNKYRHSCPRFFFRFQRLTLRNKFFSFSFPLVIFTLRARIIPTLDRKHSAGLSQLDFKSRDEQFSVFNSFSERERTSSKNLKHLASFG